MTRTALALVFIMLTGATASAQGDTGACPERSDVYQKRYEQTNSDADMACMQQAFQRELSSDAEGECPDTAEHYETAYQSGGRMNDMVCALKAKQRENQ